jgi:DNA-binding LacI/PurR family transcriptional regulator
VLQRRCRQLGVTAEHVITGAAHTSEDMADVLRGVLGRPDPVTALVCSTHGLAPAVLEGLRTARVELPGDCSFVTYGDSDWAAAYRPAIGVVTMDLYAVAVLMTRRIVDELEGDAPAIQASPPSSRFLPRESVGAVP